jgi:hypothetical protein
MTKNLSPLVAIALSLDKVSINYQVEMTPQEASEFAKNTHGNSDLERLIESINKLMPVSDGGQFFHKFLIGNEGSRVIYAAVAKRYFKKDANFWNWVVLSCNTVMKTARADEYQVIENSDTLLKLRFWWD